MAQDTTIVVNSEASESDAYALDSICDTTYAPGDSDPTRSGICTWQAALETVHASPGHYTIQFDSSVREVHGGTNFYSPDSGGPSRIVIDGGDGAPVRIVPDVSVTGTEGLWFSGQEAVVVENVWIDGRDIPVSELPVGIVYDDVFALTECRIEEVVVTGAIEPLDARFPPGLGVGCTVRNSRFGLTPNGEAAYNEDGIDLTGDGHLVSNNTIAARSERPRPIDEHWAAGIEIRGNDSRIIRNRVGVDPSGTNSTAIETGIFVDGDRTDLHRNTVAGARINRDSSEARVAGYPWGDSVSRYRGVGMVVLGDGHDLYRNRVGTDATGEVPLGNEGDGLLIRGVANCIGSDRQWSASNDRCKTFRGERFDEPADANVIGANGGHGIVIEQSCGTANPCPLLIADRNVFIFNNVGVNASRTGSLGNGGHGVLLGENVSNTLMSTTWIGSNGGHGLVVNGDSNNVTKVFVGTDGRRDLGNDGHGILVTGSDNQFGGPAPRDATVTLHQLVVAGNERDGIHVAAGVDNVVRNAWVGTVGPDAAAVPNAGNGIAIEARQTAVHNSTVAGNEGVGIRIRVASTGPQASGVRLLDNVVGLAPVRQVRHATPTPLPNGGDGIHAEADGVEVRRNVVSANRGDGLELRGSSYVVESNVVGTDPDGEFSITADGDDLGNGEFGVSEGPASFSDEAADNRLSDNVVSGNGGSGVLLFLTTDAVLERNRIGTNRPGSRVDRGLGNDGWGIEVAWTIDTRIVGTHGPSLDYTPAPPSEGNVVSGNGAGGVRLDRALNTTIAGNWIGTNRCDRSAVPCRSLANSGDAILATNATGESLIWNNEIRSNVGTGVAVHGGSVDNLLWLNTIWNHDGYGVSVEGPHTLRNTISQNSITGNRVGGIVTEHGGNAELAPPTATVRRSNGLVQVTGSTCPGCVVELFSDPGDQGKLFREAVQADADGSFHADFPVLGLGVSCTATDDGGNTSAFGCDATNATPAIIFEKRALDANGGSLEPGEELRYELTVRNGLGVELPDLPGPELTDSIPSGTTYVPGSLRVDGAPHADDPSVGAGYESAKNRIVWNGSIRPGQALTVTFRVVLGDDLRVGDVVSNQAHLGIDLDGDRAREIDAPSDDPTTIDRFDPTNVTVERGVADAPDTSTVSGSSDPEVDSSPEAQVSPTAVQDPVETAQPGFGILAAVLGIGIGVWYRRYDRLFHDR